MAYYGITTPLDASYSNPNFGLQSSSSIASPTVPTSLTATNTQQSSPITLPPPPPPSGNHSGMIAGGNATITANTPSVTTPSGAVVDPTTGKIITPPPTDTAGSVQNATGSSIPGWDAIKSYLASITKPPSATDQYNTDYTNSGVDTLQANANIDAKALKEAQAALTGSQNKLTGLNAELQGANFTTPLQNEQNAIGRGVTTDILNRQNAQSIRENAIKYTPLILAQQAETLGAQAKVAAAQGNAQLSQSILQQAQDHLDKLFQIHQTDATNQYTYRNNLIDKAYQYATAAEKDKLAEQKASLTQNLSIYNNTISDIRTAASSATASGQGGIATQLAQLVAKLDPNSKTFVSDLKTVQDTFAKLQGQITPKATSEQISQGTISTVNSQLTKAVGSDGYTDPNLYARLRSSSTLSGSDFDNRFAYLVNPESRAKLGLTNAQAGNPPIAGNFTNTQQQSLVGAGIPATQLDTIATYIGQYGLDAALKNSDMTTSQKNALKAVYGQ